MKLSCLALGVVFSVVLTPAWGQENDAEKLFRDMEAKIKSAKSYSIAFSYQTSKTPTPGRLVMSNTNQMRLIVTPPGSTKKKKKDFEIVSDGNMIKSKNAELLVASNGQAAIPPGGTSEFKTPKDFSDSMAVCLSRGGIWFSSLVLPYLARGESMADPDREDSKMRVYAFQLEGDEKFGEQVTKKIRYKFGKGDGCKDDGQVTLWIDAKTLLPHRRTIVLSRGDLTISESYMFVIDAKIPAGTFDLPK